MQKFIIITGACEASHIAHLLATSLAFKVDPLKDYDIV